MANIVCITSGLTGILHASFELAARLEAAGHQVTCASPREVETQVKAQGLAYVQLPSIPVDPSPPVPSFRGALRKIKRWQYKFQHAKARRQAAMEALATEPFLTRIQALRPDLLLIDVELHEYILTAFARKIPFVILSQWFSLWKRPGLPYLLQDTIPGKGWRGQPWAISLAWWKVKLQRYWTFKKKKWLSVGTDRRSTLLAYAQKVNFPLAYLRENYWPGPFTYDTLPVLSMTAEEMEFPHSVRPHLYYIGPQVHTDRKDLPGKEEQTKRLEAILAEQKQTGKSLIYCTVSTLHQGDQAFLKRLAQAVAAREDWLLILGMGGLIDTDFLSSLPSNVHPFAWVPQLKVLAQANCSINHGGIHTINECIHFQVPMLVYSGKRSDQNGCAARVAYHGMGIMADKDEDSVTDIRAKIEEILKGKSYALAMKQMHTFYQKYTSEKKLEKVLSPFLSPQATVLS